MSTSKPNVVLVTVDCLRRDRISAYGYGRDPGRETTPFLDSLLPTALHASSAHAASSWTCPSVASLLTGLYPSRHGAGWLPGPVKHLERDLPSALREDVEALPQMLPMYGNAAFTAVPFATMPLADRFDHVRVHDRPADALIGEALAWMRAQPFAQPSLCWIHLGDVHDPLEVPSDLREAFGSVRRYREARRWRYTRDEAAADPAGFAAYRDDRIRLYDAAVRGVDRAIASLWESLQERGDDTIMIVSADHGEELWEHAAAEREAFFDPRGVAGVGHGHNLFQVHLLVPLIIVGPNVPAKQISVNASLVDVVPTVMDLLGEPLGREEDGHSLLRLDDASEQARIRPVRAEAVAYGHEKHAVIMGDEKLLVSPGDDYREAFLLGADRTESAVASEDVVSRLAPLLTTAPPVPGPPSKADDEVVEHLRHLGYLE